MLYSIYVCHHLYLGLVYCYCLPVHYSIKHLREDHVPAGFEKAKISETISPVSADEGELMALPGTAMSQ